VVGAKAGKGLLLQTRLALQELAHRAGQIVKEQKKVNNVEKRHYSPNKKYDS
jgi:hypothetical protein